MPWSAPSRSRLETALVAAALVGVGILAFALAAPEAAASYLPPATTGVTDAFTLYGGVIPPTVGWGLAANNTTKPGPHLSVNYGDTVQLTLIAVDGATHNWFIDYNNNSFPDTGEPSSPDFSQTNSIVWNFTADNVGTFVYRCRYHPSDMFGFITISAPTHYTLYGSVTAPLVGWGFNRTDLSAPGPTLIVEAGANVTLTLYSVDNTTPTTAHTWFLDYNNDSVVSTGEPESPAFGGSGNSNPINWSFTATRTGTFEYRCGIHPRQMFGMIVVLGHAAPGSGGFPIGLIPGIMLVVIGGVLILAVVYQVRATRAARMRK